MRILMVLSIFRSSSNFSSLRRLSRDMELDPALVLLTSLGKQEFRLSAHALYGLLQGCIDRKDLETGRRVQSFLFKQHFNCKVLYLVPSLIQLFARGDSVLEAEQVFRTVSRPNARTWQAMVAAYATHGQDEQVIRLFRQMQESGVEPNERTYVAVLKACGTARALKEGRCIHAQIMATQHGESVHVDNTIIHMYISCKSLVEAWAAFNSLRSKSVVSWTTMIGGCAQQGESQQALRLFWQMLQCGVNPDMVTYVTVLRACASVGALDQAKQIHVYMVQSGVDVDLVVETCLVDVYAKCCDVQEARKVFDNMRERNVVSWSAMIGGYSQHGLGQEALELFEQMQQEGVEPNKITFLNTLKACSGIGALERGKHIHSQLARHGFQLDGAVGTSLIDMYVRCGSLEEARPVFEDLPAKDVVSWNRMIAGYAVHGSCREAIQLYEQMQRHLLKPTEITFMTLLNACSSMAALDQGKQLHADMMKCGILEGKDAAVGTNLLDMYIKCGDLASAKHVFDGLESQSTVGPWSAMIGGYVHHGLGQEALQLYKEMQQKGFKPDELGFVNVIKACAQTAALVEGRAIHARIVESGYDADMVLRSTLVDMYAKCGSMQEAREVFDTFNRDVVISNAVIGGYAQHGQGQEALLVFKHMQDEGLKPTETTFLAALKACSSIAALPDGEAIHNQVVRHGLGANSVIGSCLIEMYAKCGGVDHARGVFEALPDRDVVLWNTMIGGYALHGQAQESLQLFHLMQQEGVKPTSVTFLGLLTACGRAGLLSRGCTLFQAMLEEYGITPEVQHYAAMVDLLCRAGHLYEAKDLITNMPLAPDSVLWKSLLAACRTRGNVELGRLCFDAILKIDPSSAAAFVLMSNIYSQAGRVADEVEIRQQMKNSGSKKEPGRTWIQVNDEVHTFVAQDKEHPHRKAIYAIIKALDPSSCTCLQRM